MRRARDILLILLTAACVGVGALLPRTAAVLQERQLERSSETRVLDDVEMLIRQELSEEQILGLLGGPYTRMAWDSGTSLTEEGAMDAAFEAAQFMMYGGLIPGSAVDMSFSSGHWLLTDWGGTAEPYLLIAGDDNQTSLLLWQCSWESPGDAVYTAWIDDTTGLMCGFSRTGGAALDAAVDPGSQLALWYEFLLNYYGIWMQDIQETRYGADKVTYTLSSADADDGGTACTVRLRFEGGDFSFVI